jgi:hypothetical protein
MVTQRSSILAYLDPDVLAALNALAKETRIPRAVLIREAVDDLLAKHGKIVFEKKRATSGPPRNVHTAKSRK